MSFNTIELASNTYNSIGAGNYQLSTVDISSPSDIVKTSPGKLSGNKKLTTCSLSRHKEIDVTVGAITERRKASVIIQLQVPSGFTSSELSTLITELASVMTAEFVRRLMLGES